MTNDQKVVSPQDFIKMPAWFRGLNRIWEASYPLGTRIKLNKDSLIRSARKSTGLHDMGKDFWDEPLERMIWSINNEANLHPIGLFISKERIVNLLANRLRAEDLFKKHPELAVKPITLWDTLKLLRIRLYDEAEGRYVGYPA